MDVGQSLRRAAQINPDGISVVFGGRRRSWRESADAIARERATRRSWCRR
jgi:UDP-N-acetyl-D-mannosaminuronic acid transferase (WecB/TagA/CpsF family)